MRNKLLVFSLLGAAVVLIGCSKEEDKKEIAPVGIEQSQAVNVPATNVSAEAGSIQEAQVPGDQQNIQGGLSADAVSSQSTAVAPSNITPTAAPTAIESNLQSQPQQLVPSVASQQNVSGDKLVQAQVQSGSAPAPTVALPSATNPPVEVPTVAGDKVHEIQIAPVGTELKTGAAVTGNNEILIPAQNVNASAASAPIVVDTTSTAVPSSIIDAKKSAVQQTSGGVVSTSGVNY